MLLPTPLELGFDAPTLTAIIMAAVGSPVAVKLVEGVLAQRSGQHDLERARVQAIIDARDRAEDERDEADRRRRCVTEHAHHLRRMLIDHGIDPPPWPTTHRPPTTDSK